MSEQSEKIRFTIDKSQIGQRLDIYLAQSDADISRSHVKCIIENGDVLVNGNVPKVSQKLKEGDVIILTKRPPVEAAAVAQEMLLNIVYEDEAIIVINKPAGMVVHPAPGNPDKTLVNALLFHCHDLSGIGGVLRPGIVHRLDKDTSGLIVAAKSDDAHRQLSAQFEQHDVQKKYLALVWGNPKDNQGEIVKPVGRHTVDRKKMSTRTKRGKDALTFWKVNERFGVATLLEVEIKTGRTHQIRVHLSDLGYPVIGDAVYGNSAKIRAVVDPLLKARLKEFNRQALHAAHLSFIHPHNRKRVAFTADMPDDMTDLCAQLRLSVNPVDSTAGNRKL
ncbi:MAG: RluA family pseudouridine synthase [Deltaproteobacteria bacterium HGW-Deltaproteobacteria-13]|nr:MAG: RluA family pseudouridine synthase [Deltaproteobacteria bacterium HGW-Deltaproteobacteria-13]